MYDVGQVALEIAQQITSQVPKGEVGKGGTEDGEKATSF